MTHGAQSAVLTVMLWPHRVIEPVVAPPLAAKVPVPAAAVPPVVIAATKAPKMRPRARPASPGGSIRIETADPDVVLIFVSDGGGE